MKKITEVRIPTDLILEVKFNELVSAINGLREEFDRLQKLPRPSRLGRHRTQADKRRESEDHPPELSK